MKIYKALTSEDILQEGDEWANPDSNNWSKLVPVFFGDKIKDVTFNFDYRRPVEVEQEKLQPISDYLAQSVAEEIAAICNLCSGSKLEYKNKVKKILLDTLSEPDVYCERIKELEQDLALERQLTEALKNERTKLYLDIAELKNQLNTAFERGSNREGLISSWQSQIREQSQKIQPISEELAQEIAEQIGDRLAPLKCARFKIEVKELLLSKLAQPTKLNRQELLEGSKIIEELKARLAEKDNEIESLKEGLGTALDNVNFWKSNSGSKSQWPQPIKFSERMPEDGQSVFVYDVRGWASIHYFSGVDYLNAQGYTHWLPQPPRPSEEEKVHFVTPSQASHGCTIRPFPETPEQVQAVIDQMKSEGKSLGIPREEAAKMAKKIAKGAPIPSVKEEKYKDGQDINFHQLDKDLHEFVKTCQKEEPLVDKLRVLSSLILESKGGVMPTFRAAELIDIIKSMATRLALLESRP